MKFLRVFSVIIGLLFLVSVVSAQSGPPKAAVHEVTDTYFGQKIVDPYRWMEDSKSPETTAWMKAQADYSRSYLDRLPVRAELLKRLEALSETGVRVSGVQRAGNFYFYYRLAPGENVISDAERAEQAALLKDDRNAKPLRGVLVSNGHIRLPFEFNHARVRLIHTGEDVHERAFARTVFAD